MTVTIAQLEREECERLAPQHPVFGAGDTISVKYWVVEGSVKRQQSFVGQVIAKRGGGINSSFIVRRTSSGVAMERTFQTYSPLIAQIEVQKRGDVRRAKLYYLRQRSGRSAKIKEKLIRKIKPTSNTSTAPAPAVQNQAADEESASTNVQKA